MSSPGRYKKILVPLDGSGWAQRAIPHAIELARSHENSELILLTVFSPPAREFADQLVLAGQENQTELAREQMRQYLMGLRSELHGESVRVRAQLIKGEDSDVARHICDYVNGEGIDLIVMSTHGRTGLARLLFGSVARDVMEGIKIPVLLIRPDKE